MNLFKYSKIDKTSTKITSMTINDDLTNLAIGYENGLIMLKSKINYKFHNLSSQIICLKFDPLNEFLYVSSTDGTYAFYSLKTLNCKHTIYNSFDYVQISNDISNICPHKNGLLVCLLTNNEIKLYERYNYNAKFTIKVQEKSSNKLCFLTKVNFLGNGEFILVTNNTNTLCIYDFIKLRICVKLKFKSVGSLNSLWFYRNRLFYYINEIGKRKSINLNYS